MISLLNKKNKILAAILCSTFLTLQAQAKDSYLVGISHWVDNPEFLRNIEGFKQGLKENGFTEGKNISFITKNPSANKDEQRNIITNFLNKDVDMIYSLTTSGTLIAKELAPHIPVVFSVVTFPVEAEIIKSLESSENNLVGTRNYLPPARQFYYFDKLSPGTKALAFAHRKDEPNSIIQLNEYKHALRSRNVKVIDIAAVDLADLQNKLEESAPNIDAVYSACDTLIQSGGEDVVINFSKSYKVPSFTCNKDGVLKGALVGNVADFHAIGKLSGEKAAHILQGTKPTSIPTESPRGDYVIVNKETLDYFNLSIPTRLKKKISEIIED